MLDTFPALVVPIVVVVQMTSGVSSYDCRGIDVHESAGKPHAKDQALGLPTDMFDDNSHNYLFDLSIGKFIPA